MNDPGGYKSQLAARCHYLRQTINKERHEPMALCNHPIREGLECIGPFLEDLPTDCGLWEPHPQSHLIPAPQPERWRGRGRRGGYDMQRPWRSDWH